MTEPNQTATPVILHRSHILQLDEVCVYCLSELARGVPDDGKCGHEHMLERDQRVAKNRSGQ